MAGETSARIAWFDQLGSQTERNRPAPPIRLGAVGGLRATAGRGQVTLDWGPVKDAIGYLVARSDAPDGTFDVVDHHGGDVLAVPAPPYTDTTGIVGRPAWYRVQPISAIEAEPDPASEPVEATPLAAGSAGSSATIEIGVDARRVTGRLARPWRPVIGSEHLALLLRGPGPGGHHVGDELAEAFRIVHRELGVRSVRAHAILDDSLGVYREVDGRAKYDYERVDTALDRLLATGLEPFVELSFMPRDLASDAERTTFDYRAGISPPRDMERWSALVTDFTGHLVARYGLERVSHWPFEVWNEPNLGLFWAATEAEYFDLYDATARAVRAVDQRLAVGGPSTAAVGWIDDLLFHGQSAGVPVDFVSTHTYGAPPLDLRPIARRYGQPQLPLHWTEWGVSPTHSAPVNDSVWGAPLVCRGMRSAAGRVASLSYWVASDHFVELGEAESFLHGGFGLLTIGNIRKPRYWALAILERLGDEEIVASVDGDGAGGLVEAWASRHRDGAVSIALWNGTLDQSKAEGDPLLDRSIRLRVEGLGTGSWSIRHFRVDATHSNVSAVWAKVGGGDWPDDAGWHALREADRLDELEPERVMGVSGDGSLDVEFELPMPAISLIELRRR